jgi:hypothetical protein
VALIREKGALPVRLLLFSGMIPSWRLEQGVSGPHIAFRACYFRLIPKILASDPP